MAGRALRLRRKQGATPRRGSTRPTGSVPIENKKIAWLVCALRQPTVSIFAMCHLLPSLKHVENYKRLCGYHKRPCRMRVPPERQRQRGQVRMQNAFQH